MTENIPQTQINNFLVCLELYHKTKRLGMLRLFGVEKVKFKTTLVPVKGPCKIFLVK